jgi:hypothetical protein
MSWTNQSVFKLILMRNSDRTARTYIGTSYIGVGDQFDDDRRLICETALGSAAHPTSPKYRFHYPASERNMTICTILAVQQCVQHRSMCEDTTIDRRKVRS